MFKEVHIKLVPGKTRLSNELVDTPQKAIAILGSLIKDMNKECVGVINLDTKLKPINFSIVSTGTIDQTYCDCKEIFKTTLLSNANRIILMHNHPSGSLEPSRMDENTTDHIKKASNILGIELLDHIIVAYDRYEAYSFSSNKVFQFERMDHVLEQEDEFEL